jgi:hypothetical protein
MIDSCRHTFQDVATCNTHLCANQAGDAVHQPQLLAHLEALQGQHTDDTNDKLMTKITCQVTRTCAQTRRGMRSTSPSSWHILKPMQG